MVEKGYQTMRSDKKAAVTSWSNTNRSLSSAAYNSVDTVDMISFNFQQNLPTPNLHHNDVFYACQLWTYMYNFGIHDCVADKGICSCGMRRWQSVGQCRSPLLWNISFRPTAQVLDLWFLFLMGAVGKTRIWLSLACTTNFTLAGSKISLS